MFDVSIKEKNINAGISLLGLRGNLDSVSAIDFYDFINEELSRDINKFIIDCEDLNFISSAGISIIIRLKRKLLEKNSVFVFTNLNKEILELFKFFGMNKLLLISESNEEALKLISSLYPSLKEETKPEEKPKQDLQTLETKQVVIKDISESLESIALDDSLEEITNENISNNKKELSQNKDHRAQKSIPANPSEKLYFETSESSEVEYIEEISTLPLNEDKPEKQLSQSSDLSFSVPFITKKPIEFNDEDKILDSIPELPSIPYQKLNNEGAQNKEFNELIITCESCGTKIRITKEGKQSCPTCGSKFNLRQSGSISTIEKI